MVRRLGAHALPLAVLTALVAAFVPSVLLVLPVLAVALVIGSVAAGEVLASARAVVVALAA